MEVHHHSHTEPGNAGTSRKKFTHYLWEFLMLFLAVFAGFLAENLREHIVEHRRAEQFARSLLADLGSDTAALKIAIDYGDKKVNAIDSFFFQIELGPGKWNDTMVYKYGGAAGRIRPFERNSGTYEQMKASGSLRYFRQELADLLNKYDAQAKKVVARENIGLKYVMDFYNPFQVQILDSRSVIRIQDGITPAHPLVFRKTDKETIALWINYAAIVQSTQERTLIEYNVMRTKANEIIEALQKDYHLK
jgi:hypothetical protein